MELTALKKRKLTEEKKERVKVMKRKTLIE